MKKNNQKGFTLMEMLIVVAIIAILVAIAIPTLTKQLEKSREAADIANIRTAYAEAMMDYLDTKNTAFPVEKDSQAMLQANSGWDYVEWPSYLGGTEDVEAGQTVTVSIDADGTVTCEAKAN